jgi:transposase
VCLEDLVPTDHRVRLVWQFVEGLDLSALYAAIKAVEGQPGHPPADPRILLALWLYATVAGVGSAQALARLCETHIGYQWLCGGVGMNAKTLADFRVAQGAALERLLVDNVGSDMGKLAPMNEALATYYGQRPGEHLADGGYTKLETSRLWPRPV